jgi:hypothetical protein
MVIKARIYSAWSLGISVIQWVSSRLSRSSSVASISNRSCGSAGQRQRTASAANGIVGLWSNRGPSQKRKNWVVPLRMLVALSFLRANLLATSSTSSPAQRLGIRLSFLAGPVPLWGLARSACDSCLSYTGNKVFPYRFCTRMLRPLASSAWSTRICFVQVTSSLISPRCLADNCRSFCKLWHTPYIRRKSP